ncbi:hypothetical protein IWQ60_009988, partial [Tieghemiomyces parasiticus]
MDRLGRLLSSVHLGVAFTRPSTLPSGRLYSARALKIAQRKSQFQPLKGAKAAATHPKKQHSASSIPPSASTNSTLSEDDRKLVGVLKSVIRQQGIAETEKLVVQLVQNQGLHLSVHVYNVFIHYYGRVLRMVDMERWYRRLQRAAKKSLKSTADPASGDTADRSLRPDIYTYTIVTNAYNRAGRGDQAIATWRDFQSSGIPLNAVYVSVLLDTFGFHHRSELLIEFWEALQKPAQVAFPSGGGEPAAAMTESPPNTTTTVTTAGIDAAQPGTVATVVIPGGYEHSENQYNSYLEALVRLGRLQQAVDVFCTQMWPPPGTPGAPKFTQAGGVTIDE